MEYFFIFSVMLTCVTVGIWIGLKKEHKAYKKQEEARYRPIQPENKESGVTKTKRTAHESATSTPTPIPDAPTSEAAAPIQPGGVLSSKVDPEFDDELNPDVADAIEEKMRNQDASFNTLGAQTE